jgi:ATP-dependent protease Clp ATPase subunit
MGHHFNIVGQDTLVGELQKIMKIFKASDCKIRPHFILTGPSGSGKSLTVKTLSEQEELAYLEINAAQLTKEGTSGNSLSKALSPLLQIANKPAICFVDEFDKLFISGNSNDSCAHESTTGVQNEFLKVLESDVSSVFGDYGKYVNASTANVLFIFAGAFNNEPDIDLDRLREIGIKTEFLGRVGLVYSTKPLTLDDLYRIVDKSKLLNMYINLFEGSDKEAAVYKLKAHIKRHHEMNSLGARMINTLIHQYFIKGGLLEEKESNTITFKSKLTM